MNDKVVDLFENPKFNLARMPIKGHEESLGCSNCGKFLFAIISVPHGAVLRCGTCYTDIKNVLLVEVPEVKQEVPVIIPGGSE